MPVYKFPLSSISNKKDRQIPFIWHGIFGATAGSLGICIVQPADLLKTRMQLEGLQGKRPSFIGVTSSLLKNEGVKGLYKGLTCAIFRQYTYGLTRFTIFYHLLDMYKGSHGHSPNILQKMAIGVVAGVGGAIAGTPAEVTLIRMTADGNLPPEKRRGYTHVFNALYRIVREEGLFTLWRGVEATMTRAMCITAAELGSYAQSREMLSRYLEEGIVAHFIASMISGLCATTASLPADIVKTRVQQSKIGEGQITIFKQIIKNEGVLALWAGFLPTYAKLGPHAVITFMIFEQMYVVYWKIADHYSDSFSQQKTR